MMAYAKYDYKGSPAAETLTLARGEALTVLEGLICFLKKLFFLLFSLFSFLISFPPF
jgi:hypothetical protein